MARRGRKRAVAESRLKPNPPSDDDAQQQFEQRHRAFSNREAELRVAAVEAIRVAETESLLSRLRLLRSYFSKEQLEELAVPFFKKNLRNFSLIKNEKHGLYELEWKQNVDSLPGTIAGATNANVSLDGAANARTVDAIQFSVDSARKSLLEGVRKSFLGSVNLHLAGSVLDELSENLVPGTVDSFRTPGVDHHRYSFGVTPTTLRLPKNGEMLLSVHGSPLGVYKEENLEAIHESDDGSNGDGS